ncbi:galactosyl transferase GMA12/MNN10 family-domain-containing protein [Zychaea mexicana]|uniref:galactosyl transferase GMA12/MNN10 family-domain-containing protein n=1 Tax=Zychaea mexicana TaxID=64656 RepID=UPI0022FF1658|nr:galactosyl transferase GMA12/MNN10 family-domain-containing protein [Zychaea mexicana]KAI9468683.1 galactosyl transferase GMA12/MNN10 family-domain-containing protein [Zychaea mexicana]
MTKKQQQQQQQQQQPSPPHEALWIGQQQPLPGIDGNSTRRAVLMLLLTCLLFLLAFNARLVSKAPAEDGYDLYISNIIPSKQELPPLSSSSVFAGNVDVGTGAAIAADEASAGVSPAAPRPAAPAILPPAPAPEDTTASPQKPPFSDDDDGQGTLEASVVETTDGSIHYAYIIVIASEAPYQSRRNLIRSSYFGLYDNLIPCMRYNTDVFYTFWIHGGPPPSNTPQRRQYEAEKMEWNDMVEMPSHVPFEQETVLDWVESTLKTSRRIEYDYLIIQDIETFLQLHVIKRELDAGVIGEYSNMPYVVSMDQPLNLIWGSFSGTEDDKHAAIIGADAAQLAMSKRDQIQQQFAVSKHLLTNTYNYYRAVSGVLKAETDATLEPEEAVEEQGRLIPEFVREDRFSDTRRFIRWENNVESVHIEDQAITKVYQDSDFSDLARWTSLRSLSTCTRHYYSSDRPNDRDPASIAVVTSSYIYDSCMEPSATLAAENKRQYAIKHGYSFVARSSEFAQQLVKHRKIVWGKIDVVEKLLPKYRWLFWLDMDAVVMDQSRSIEALLEKASNSYQGNFNEIDLIIARPHQDKMINAGVFLIRNSRWSLQFLREVQDTIEWYNRGPSFEQGAMADVINRPENRNHVLLLDGDDQTFNTLPRLYTPNISFVVHFAPDKCPNDAVLKGLEAADIIRQGGIVSSLDEE